MYNDKCNDNIDGLNKIIVRKSYYASSSDLTPSANINVMQIDQISNSIDMVNSCYYYNILFLYYHI